MFVNNYDQSKYPFEYLIEHFILRDTNSIFYYPQGNGQAKSINKVFGTLITKLVNDNGTY